MEKKEINIGVTVNGNLEGARISLPAQDVDALIALYNQAKATVLQGVDEEQEVVFDPWLKSQNPALYEKAMKAFCQKYDEWLNSEPFFGDDWDMMGKYVSLERDIDGAYLDDSNEILVESFSL